VSDRLFDTASETLVVYWGIKGIDRSGTDFWNETDLGEVLYDAAFDAADPAAQTALLRACEELSVSPGLAIERCTGVDFCPQQESRCLMSAFAEWSRAPERNLSFPVPRSRFIYAMANFLQHDPEMLSLLSFEPTSLPITNASEAPSWRLPYVAATFSIAVNIDSSHGRAVYDRWQAKLRQLNDAAPLTAKHATQTSPSKLLWQQMSMHELYLSLVSTVVPWSIVVGFCFIFVATHSLRISVLSVISLVFMLGAWLGLAVMSGFFAHGMGIMEALVITIAIGLTLDPLVHVAFAFSEASGTTEQRLHHAVTTVGISVLAAGASTAGSCSIMMLTTIVVFSRFAKLVCSLVIVALIYSNFFLAPMLLLFGDDEHNSPLRGIIPLRNVVLQLVQRWPKARPPDRPVNGGVETMPVVEREGSLS